MAGGKRKGEEAAARLPSKTAKGSLEQRAAWCLSYVRALNTQFAAWVEQQKKEHPDELWEGGVEDYVKHANKLLTDYKDVVDWLKNNAQPAEAVAVADAPLVFGTADASGRPNITSATGTTAFGSSASAACFGRNASGAADSSDTRGGSVAAFCSPFPLSEHALKGVKKEGEGSEPIVSVPGAVAATSGGIAAVRSPIPLPSFATRPAGVDTERKDGAAAGSDEEEQPPSPSLKNTEEKGVQVVHQVRGRLFFQVAGDEKGWKSLGGGQIILRCREDAPKATKDAKPTLVFRNEVGKVLLNALLYAGMKVKAEGKDITLVLTVASVAGQPEWQACLLRLKSVEDAAVLAEALLSHCPT